MNDKVTKTLKTFCPLPWIHLSASSEGLSRVCCDSLKLLKNNETIVRLKESKNLHSYFNSTDYKKIRTQMLKGERPSHCYHCFNQEDHGVHSIRKQFVTQYKSIINNLIKSTNNDGSIDNPNILYIDMVLGNKCNLKCRMCSPWSSYPISKDWIKMNKEFDIESAKKIYMDKWFLSSNYIQILKEALPSIQVIFITGGEPMIIKEHVVMLEMIVKEGHAKHIKLRYNTNQTSIPERLMKMFSHFKNVQINCSIEAHGKLNNYIRHPSRWDYLEKNIYLLDALSQKQKSIEIFIHTTLQAYNVIRIPELLDYLTSVDFKNIYRFPFFIWVKDPEWLSPTIFPKNFRIMIAQKIIESLDRHENFFLNYNKAHQNLTKIRMLQLRQFSEMIKNKSTDEKYLKRFIKETNSYDALRNQSIIEVLPEVSHFFQ